LRGHVAHQIVLFLPNALFNGLPQRVSGQIRKIVIRQVFELDLIGRAFEPRRVRNRYAGVGKLPDPPNRIFERSVAINHHFDLLACLFQKALLDIEHQPAAIPREQLDRVFRGFIRAEQTICFIAAAAIHRRV